MNAIAAIWFIGGFLVGTVFGFMVWICYRMIKDENERDFH